MEGFVELDDLLLIKFTKLGDKLPLTTFQMSTNKACMDSDSQVSSHYYPIELNKATSCPLEPTTAMIVDPRYRNAASDGLFEFGEWDIMKENGVQQILEALPSYRYSLGGIDPSVKNSNTLSFKVRNTIPWSLECELVKGEDRYYGYEQFSISLDQESGTVESMEYLSITAYSLIGFWAFGTCCCGGCASVCGGEGGAVVPVFLQLLNRISIIVMSSIFISYLRSVQEITDDNLYTLSTSTDSDCSDKWSRVNIQAATDQMHESESLNTSAIIFISFTLVWIIGVEFCCACCCVMCAVSKPNIRCNLECDHHSCLRQFSYFMQAYKEVN